MYELGVCSAPLAKKYNGVNNGKNAGRLCWYVAGTFCEGKVNGTFCQKLQTCLDCEFYKEVKSEENNDFVMDPVAKDYIKSIKEHYSISHHINSE